MSKAAPSQNIPLASRAGLDIAAEISYHRHSLLILHPSPLDRFPFLLSNLKLTVEAPNGHEGVLYGGLHGDPELALLLAKLKGNPFQDFWELPQDLQRNMPVGS